jgi:hypothetical protein
MRQQCRRREEASMGDIIFKIILLILVLGLLVFIWHGDRRNRLEREAEERAALEAQAHRREDGSP